MNRAYRVGGAAMLLALAGASPALAQIQGMPLFTNPRFATGIRVHADYGVLTNNSSSDFAVVQGGLGLVLGPVGIDANVGTTLATAKSASSCNADPYLCANGRATGSALLQLHLAGGGMSNLSLSAFGGASMDFSAGDIKCSGGGSCGPSLEGKLLNIPVGAAIGLHVPLGLASLNLWGAPRYTFGHIINCPSGTTCTNPKGNFGWAVGADLPIFRIISVRAAYDSHKDQDLNKTISVIGAGVSIGIGGMR